MADWTPKIDWITMVVPMMAVGEGATYNYFGERLKEALDAEHFPDAVYEALEGMTALEYGRAPYEFGWQNKEAGLTVWAGTKTPHASLEFSGKGCDWLTERGVLHTVVTVHSERLSRIDIAVDVQTDERPTVFVQKRIVARQKTHSEIVGASGETCYIGSMQSEQYARVYRYNEPHPRAHLLRLEHVFRRKHAKRVGAALAEQGLNAVVMACFEQYGWDTTHIDGVQPSTVSLAVDRPERNGGKTLYWLIKSVAPAFKKLVKEGVISNPHAFLAQYFLGDDEEFFLDPY